MPSVQAIMRSVAAHFSEDENRWKLVGLLRDIDCEKTEVYLKNTVF